MKKIYYYVLLLPIVLITGCDKSNSGLEWKDREPINLTRAEEGLMNSSNRFAFDLFRLLHEDIDSRENFVYSPLSLTLALSMLNNGAVGETQEQISETLGFQGYTPSEINAFYRKMLDAVANIDPLVTIESANSIWIKEEFPVKSSFVETNQTSYDAEVKNVDFLAPETLGQINSWVSDKTHGKIKDMLDGRDLNDKTVMLLMNALYFNGLWADEFDTKATYKKDFICENGVTVVKDMMPKLTDAKYRKTELYRTASLPFGNGAFEMSFILPNEEVKLSEALEGIEDACIDGTDIGTIRKIDFLIPKFKINSQVNLVDFMKELGMEIPFGIDADFSDMHSSGRTVFISLIKQKAFVEVKESGAEATAATVVGVEFTSTGGEPELFHLDRPFIFMIREVSTGAIFFMGEVNR